MGSIQFCLVLYILSSVSSDKLSRELAEKYLNSKPLHLRFRTPTSDIWSPEVQQAGQTTNERYSGAFPAHAACSSIRTDLQIGDTGVISSPNYPRNYPGNAACEWIVEGPNGSRIQAVLLDVSTQPFTFFYFDYVMLARDGDFRKVDRMTGDLNAQTPKVLLSDHNVLGIRFRSSAFLNYRGFKVQWLVIQDPDTENRTFETTKALEGSVFDGMCGRSSTTESESTSSAGVRVEETKIFNGTESGKHAYPWMAALLIDKSKFCGGSLIDEQHILTAAHCTFGAKDITILLGAHDIESEEEPGRLLFNVTRSSILQHPEYNPHTASYDISIIRLPEKLAFTDRVKPICLPNSHYQAHLFVDDQVRIAGWGKTTDAAAGVNPTLQEADMKIVSNSECRLLFRGLVTGNQMCVSPFKNAAPCKGDSGGPLMLKHETQGSFGPFYMQVGILSYGSLTCESGLPGGATRLTAFMDYVNHVTGKHKY